VGAALIVKLTARRFTYTVAAPTMRVPGSVAGTINAYLSMRAALTAVLQHNAAVGLSIRRLAVPSLCTGVGRMPYEEAAKQMRTAYESVIGGRWRQVVHPAMAPYALGNEQGIPKK
jgi:O-acetyl-ADP-ribose deacetylase (regulator of RNase III)